tara:strand:+ start:18375 stop:18905 length:531 start_codon:yes stop_codon:yes gene_type:complete
MSSNDSRYDGFGRFGHGVGVNNVGSYQVSGIPWASASILVPASQGSVTAKGVKITTEPAKIEFPYVTKFVTIRHDPTGSNYGVGPNNGIRVGFSEAGASAAVDRFYFELSGSESITLEVKTKELYLISCDETIKEATVIAGLTNIRSKLIESGTLVATSDNADGVRFNYSGSVGVG